MYIKVYDKERRVQLPGDYQFTTPEELMDIANSENKSELFKINYKNKLRQ
ncbi:MAG: hypothetical protein CM15mV51_1100 [uncultured marine virus]|nr:MAG: hypothetical protein CM15mV51_1100 [uncultured marine virus]